MQTKATQIAKLLTKTFVWSINHSFKHKKVFLHEFYVIAVNFKWVKHQSNSVFKKTKIKNKT